MSVNPGSLVSAPPLTALLLAMMCGATLPVCAQSYAGVAQANITPRRRAVKIRSLYRMRQTGEAIPPTVGSLPWTLPLHVQVMQISDSTAIVGLPGELFAALGMAIKEKSPFPTTLIIELTNSHIAYIPNREAFAQGSYETINSRLAPGGGELMLDTAVRLLHELAGDDRKVVRHLTKTIRQ